MSENLDYIREQAARCLKDAQARSDIYWDEQDVIQEFYQRLLSEESAAWEGFAQWICGPRKRVPLPPAVLLEPLAPLLHFSDLVRRVSRYLNLRRNPSQFFYLMLRSASIGVDLSIPIPTA